jgi:dolichol-phosphate mannosyltransferase
MINISLIIPTYNEAKNLPLLVGEIWNLLDKEKIDMEFIFVDDNSPDGTGQIAGELSKKYPIKVIHRAGKLGLGSAVIEGFKLSDRPFLGVMDADLSHDPAILNSLILSLKDNDIAVGSRFESGSSVEKWAFSRKFISKIGVFLARQLTDTKDPLSGYFFFKKEIIDNVKLETIGYKILLEILVKGKYDNVVEYPFTFRMRQYSTSKLNNKEFLFFLKQLVEYSFYKLFSSSINSNICVTTRKD